MSNFIDMYPLRESPGMTGATPISGHPYADIFSAAAQNQLVAGTDNLVAEPAAREQAYDARIKAIKNQTGIELENPERGGYSIEARRAIRQAVIAGGMSPIDEPGGIPAYQKRIFDEKVAELQAKHPDLTVGDINAEARAISHAAGDELGRAMGQPDLNPVLKYGTEFAGSLYGERRNPLFLGSLFAGPASAVGRTALARIVNSAWKQGLYNAGLTLAAQPVVQKWQADIGRESGIVPAAEDVAIAGIMGMIPGAAIEGVKELAGPLRRLLSGRPEPGDLAKAGEALGPGQPSAVAAARAGEESLAADAAALHGPAPEGVAPELHDDLVGAALKRADDPSAPSPEAVAAVQARPDEAAPPVSSELQARIEQAAPQTPADAMRAADEALDDFGRRDGMAALRERMQEARVAQDEATETWRASEDRQQRARSDVLNKIPMVRRDGTASMTSERTVRSMGDIEQVAADLVRSCK